MDEIFRNRNIIVNQLDILWLNCIIIIILVFNSFKKRIYISVDIYSSYFIKRVFF